MEGEVERRMGLRQDNRGVGIPEKGDMLSMHQTCGIDKCLFGKIQTDVRKVFKVSMTVYDHLTPACHILDGWSTNRGYLQFIHAGLWYRISGQYATRRQLSHRSDSNAYVRVC